MALNLLNIARSAILVHQRAIDQSGHNIANASTEGYTRQRIRLEAATPLRSPWGMIGRGVQVGGLERIRDIHVDKSYRSETSLHSMYTALGDTLGRVEAVFGEPSELGLGASLDAFWNAWSDLANEPVSQSARRALQGVSRNLVGQFNSAARGLDDIEAQVLDRLRGDVRDLNSFLTSLSDLNDRIGGAEAGGRLAPDLRDQRDLVLDQISSIIEIEVNERENGTVQVTSGGVSIVDGSTFEQLTIRAVDGGGFGISTESRDAIIDITEGRLGGLADLSRNGLPEVRNELNRIVNELVREVNAFHNTGVTIAGNPATDFFAPAGVTADTIALSTGIANSANNIAAGGGSGPGDASVALQIASLRDRGIAALDDQSIGGYYGDIMTSIGIAIREADVGEEAQATLVSSLSNQRAAVSSVSMDEELIKLIGQQQAYGAAARLVTVADEMMQEVLRMV